jgi:hypothetical protein
MRSMTGTPSLSRNGSISSLSRMDVGSPRSPPSRPGSRPTTPGFGSPSVFTTGFIMEEPQEIQPMELEPSTSISNSPNLSASLPRRTGSATGMGSRDASPQRKISTRYV